MAFTHTYAAATPSATLLLAGSAYPGPRVVLLTPAPVFLYDLHFGGRYQITGTLKIDDTPTDVPVARRAFLLVEPGLNRIGATFSDPVTGAYAFTNLSNAYRYTVLALDYTHTYRAVVADNITPDAMP